MYTRVIVRPIVGPFVPDRHREREAFCTVFKRPSRFNPIISHIITIRATTCATNEQHSLSLTDTVTTLLIRLSFFFFIICISCYIIFFFFLMPNGMFTASLQSELTVLRKSRKIDKVHDVCETVFSTEHCNLIGKKLSFRYKPAYGRDITRRPNASNK